MLRGYFLPIIVITAFLNAEQLSAYAVKGVLDLRLESFQSSIPLEGQWEVYWGQIKSPRDIFDGTNHSEFPHLWKGLVVGQDTLLSEGVATYRLKVILPNSVDDYELYIDDMYSAYSLYVDGELVASNGVVGKSKDESVPEWKPLIVSLPQQSGIMELVLSISNWRHTKGGANNPILLSKAGQIKRTFQTFTYSQITLYIFCLLVSIYFFYRFVFRTYDWASFFYALFLIVYSYRLIGADTYLLHQWVSYYPWSIAIRVEYFSLFGSTIFFSLYVFHLYRKKVKLNFLIPLLSICLIFSVFTVVTEPSFFTALLPPFFAVLIFYILYGFYLFTIAAINGEIGSVYGVVSVAIVFTSFVYQILYYVGWLEYFYLVTLIAHVFFLVFQSIQLYKYSEHSMNIDA